MILVLKYFKMGKVENQNIWLYGMQSQNQSRKKILKRQDIGKKMRQKIKRKLINIIFQYNKITTMIGETKQTFFTVKDLSAQEFIQVFGQHLKKNNLIERPAWVDRVKLSTRNELAPIDEDWIYYKVASLARKIYTRPRAGVRLLSHIYGGLYRGKVRSERHEHAGTKVIRWGLQQLEKQKIIKKDKKGDSLKINSRIVTDEGRGTLNRIVTEYLKNKQQA